MKAKNGARKSRLVAEVLSGAWRSSDFPPLQISEPDLDEVTPLLCASGAAALGWHRINNSEVGNFPSAQVLHEAYRLQSLQAEIREQKVEKVFRLLRQASVEALLAKGWAAARFYTDTALRPHGDIDICVHPKHFKVAEEVFRTPEASDCSIDLHRHFPEIDDRTIDDLFTRSRLVSLGEEQIRILGLEDHLALLCIHLLKHGAWRPLWLCDIGAAMESLPSTFNWDVCLGRSRRHAQWIACAIVLAQRLLGARIDRLPPESRPREIPDWLVQNVLHHWSNLFPGDQLPMRPPPLMASSLKARHNIVKGIINRWPDPITATFNLKGQFNNFPRLPYQFVNFALSAGRFLFQLPTKLQSQS